MELSLSLRRYIRHETYGLLKNSTKATARAACFINSVRPDFADNQEFIRREVIVITRLKITGCALKSPLFPDIYMRV